MSVPKLRFKEFDGDWIKSKLGSEAQFFQGEQVSLDDQCSEYAHGLIKFLRIENFTQKSKDFRYIRYTGSQEKILVEQDIAIVRYGATAGFICSGETGVIANNLFKVSVDNKKINQKYLELVLKSEKTFNYFQAEMSGGAMPALNFKIVGNLDITYSSIQEQTQIASFLSSVDEKISQLTQKHQLLNQYKQGMMQQLFSQQIRFKADDGSEFEKWEEKKLGEVCRFINGRAYKQTEWEKKGTPVIRLQNLTGSGKEYYYSNLNLPDHQYCYNNDLLYMWSATFGPVFWQGEKAIFHYHIWKIEVHPPLLDKKYMYFLLDEMTEKMKRSLNGSTMLHVTKQGMENTRKIIPSLPEQIKIANFLSAIDQKIEVVTQQIEQAKTWKKGLLQQMFV